MRWHEIESGLRLPVSAEEQEILTQATGGLSPEKMDERQREVAHMMVSRGLLKRMKKNGKQLLFPSSVRDIPYDA